jgi:hypothetical protein
LETLQALPERRFESLSLGAIEAASLERFREAAEAPHALLGGVGVNVVTAIAEALHQPRRGVAEMERHWISGSLLDGTAYLRVGGVDGVTLRGQRQIKSRLSQGQVSFGRAQTLVAVPGGEGLLQSPRVRQSDVLAGKTNHAAGDVEGILPGGQHAGKPVESRVGIALAEGLVKGGDQIEVLLAGAVVEQGLALGETRHLLLRCSGETLSNAVFYQQLEEVQGLPRVSGGELGNSGEGLAGQLDASFREALLAVFERPSHQELELGETERLENDDPTARQERGVQLERRVLGSCADQDDVAPFDIGEKGVLLSPIEAMNLVDEEKRAASLGAPESGGIGHDLLDLLDPRGHGAERHEAAGGLLRDDPGDCGLSRSGRSPEDDRRHPVLEDRPAEEPPRTHHRLLAQHLV